MQTELHFTTADVVFFSISMILIKGAAKKKTIYFINIFLCLFFLFDFISRYERLLRRARTEDLSEVSGIGCLYQSGVDRLGRPVVVFCGKWFPAHNIDLEKALLYLIYLLDPIVKGDYVIAYFHTLTNSNNYPSLHWLKEVYSILPYK